MGIPDLFVRRGLFFGTNVRVTQALPNEPRSESSIVVDPRNPNRLLGVSKRFTVPHEYRFSLGAVFSLDGGATWNDLPAFPLAEGYDVYSDPSATFDTTGGAWVMGDPGFFPSPDHPGPVDCSGGGMDPEDLRSTHMLAFKSANNGASWGSPIPIVNARCMGDDKGWIACDNSTATVIVPSPTPGPPATPAPSSPYHGRLYAVWGS